MIGATRERFSRYFSFEGRNRFADAIATCTMLASQRSCKRPCIVASKHARRSSGTLSSRALCRGAFPPCGNPPVTFAQNVHHSGNLRDPHQRRRPPNLPCKCHCRIRTAGSASIAQQKLHFFHQVVVRQTEQFRHARILERGHRHSAPLHDRGQPPRDARAKLALRVPEKPPSRVPPLSVRVFTHQRNHRLPSSFWLLGTSLFILPLSSSRFPA